MTLRKAPPVVRCDFPSWFKNQKHWHTLSGSTAYTFHQKWVSNLTLWKKLMAVSSCVVINFHCNQLHLMRWKCELSKGEGKKVSYEFHSRSLSFRMFFSFIINISIESGLTICTFLYFLNFFTRYMRCDDEKSPLWCCCCYFSPHLPFPFLCYFIFYFHARKSFFSPLVHSIFNPTRNTVMDCTNCFYCTVDAAPAIYILYNNMPKTMFSRVGHFLIFKTSNLFLKCFN